MFIDRVDPGTAYRSFMFLTDLFTDAPTRVRPIIVTDWNESVKRFWQLQVNSVLHAVSGKHKKYNFVF